VGDGTGVTVQDPALRESSDNSGDSTVSTTAVASSNSGGTARSRYDSGRRRFSLATLIAIVVTAVPFLWILWGPWESPNALRQSNYQDNFYDLQARAMFHGHLWLANGAIGIEAFVHGGHQYTYFGLFPSLIRMPILLLTHSLDGRLTAPYMLAAWLLTGLFTSLLLWRVRVIVRGPAVMSWGEATASGVLVATVLGGTIWMLLAATPFVFNEDIAWSICLTVGSLFALLGLLERPSWGRVIASFALVLAANLDRATTGWACAVAAGMIAIWFAMGWGGDANRRWWMAAFGVGFVPLLISCAVNYSKFGVLFGVSNYEQVWTHVNAYRRKFLAANHNSEEGVIFIPTNILNYFRPDGLRLSSVFPFISLPSRPTTPLGSVLFDRIYRTASLPSSSPLLCLLSCWGLVTAFRPKAIGKVALSRILLLAAGSAGAALLLWGYIAPRYLGDFVPFLVLASVVALVDIWRRLEGRRGSLRFGALAALTVLALFSMAANIGMAITPTDEWSSTQTLNYVKTIKTVSDLTGTSLRSRVVQGSSLPVYGPADELYVVDDCNGGLYISNGEDNSTVPSQQYVRYTWMPVEYGHTFHHTFVITFHSPASGGAESTALVSVGTSSVYVNASPTENGRVQVSFSTGRAGGGTVGSLNYVSSGTSDHVSVTTDPDQHLLQVILNGKQVLTAILANNGLISSDISSGNPPNATPAISVLDTTATSPEPTLCRSLIR
jgi:hypothetical protein